MPIDISVPQSPGWWLHRLADKLGSRVREKQGLVERFEGNPPLPKGAENAEEVYQAFQKKARTNYAELIVEAARERMTPTGFRTAVSDGEDGDLGDRVARQIWDGNGLNVEIADVLGMMLTAGDSYMIVGGIDPSTGVPIITGEDPRQVVTIHDPVQQRKVRAALKMFHDAEAEQDLAYVYLPGRVHRAYRDTKRRAGDRAISFTASAWEWDEARGGVDGAALPDPDMMPVVRFRNKRGRGEFESHIDLLDRINHMLLQRMVIATAQAFRQMAVIGLPDEDDDGQEIDYTDILVRTPGAFWQLPEGVNLWESGQVDLTPILSSVKDDVRDLAAVTRTPLSYLSPDAASQSAEGASLMREGHVFKVEDRITRATEALRDVMALAFTVMGDTDRAQRGALQVVWAPPERRSLAERADAASKAADLPFRSRMIHIWGFSPAQVEDMEAERATDAFFQIPAAPVQPAPTVPA